MTSQLRDDIETIFNAALDSVRAGTATRANIARRGDRHVGIAGHDVRIGRDGVFAIAIGKASVAMIDAAADVLGECFSSGLAITKSEPDSVDSRVRVLRGAHPVPNERSIAAGRDVLEFAADVPDNAVVLCLISGGGSSLVEQLRDGVELSQLQRLTSRLLNAGASIQELNAVRSRLSSIKAGGLLRALSHARVYNLIVSDVLGDDLQTIASGPTVPPVDQDAESVMKTYGLTDALPPASDDAFPPQPPTTVIANLALAIDHASRAAGELGYQPIVLTRSFTGEARDVGRVIAAIVADGASGLSAFGHRTCILAGGETTVTVRGTGVGGRNSEAALAAAIRLSGSANVALGFLATDGDDGTTGVAGAIVDGATVSRANLNLATTALEHNDSYTFLSEHRAELAVGQTGTNVNDLVIGLIG